MHTKPLRAIIFTALPVEFDAVAAHLTNLHEVEHQWGTLYEVGTFASAKYAWEVGVVQTGAGNPRAALEVERAITQFAPSHVFFVGVAGGLKDVRLGDVVAVTKVYAYESGKADVEYKLRAEFGESSYPMIQRASAVARKREWLRRIVARESDATVPRAVVGAIAAGEKVIASTTSAVYILLKQQFSDALAVEMESFGFFRAVHANPHVQALVVRGISDLIDAKSEADASGSQERASHHAAAFAFEVLAHLNPGTQIQKSADREQASQASEWWDRLTNIATQLYPPGPTDRQIWSRAGGDIATLDLQGSGRATWFDALRTLRLGGGGSTVTVQRLIQTMREDFANNPDLQRLFDTLDEG